MEGGGVISAEAAREKVEDTILPCLSLSVFLIIVCLSCFFLYTHLPTAPHPTLLSVVPILL